jgi:hypothetical protein
MMHDLEFGAESLDETGAAALEYGAGANYESGAEDTPFSEIEEMQLAAQLLEITDENELDGFIGSLIGRAARGARRLASSPELRGLLLQAAKRALPMIGGGSANLIGPGVGSKLAAAAGNLFGLELEGLSPEDQEFEVAKRFVRFAGASARNAARSRGRFSASRALGAAARRHAPGFLRRPRRGVRISGGWPGYDPRQPIPLAVTCQCACGGAAASPDSATTATGDSKSLPDAEPADSTDSQPQSTKGNDMHDLDRTTMELSDEGEFEFPEMEGEYGESPESPFSEEEESELAAELLEITDEQELDQFIGSLLKKAKRFVGGALKSPLLRPLGGFIKGAIKKALPAAGGALGNMFVPGIGGQLGSQLASKAGDLLGLEFENAGPEDQEFEVAKRLVRMAGTAVQNAAQTPMSGDPHETAKSAMVAAAQAHVPGLVQSQARRNGGHRRPRSGRWYRRHGRIVLVGV